MNIIVLVSLTWRSLLSSWSPLSNCRILLPPLRLSTLRNPTPSNSVSRTDRTCDCTLWEEEPSTREPTILSISSRNTIDGAHARALTNNWQTTKHKQTSVRPSVHVCSSDDESVMMSDLREGFLRVSHIRREDLSPADRQKGAAWRTCGRFHQGGLGTARRSVQQNSSGPRDTHPHECFGKPQGPLDTLNNHHMNTDMNTKQGLSWFMETLLYLFEFEFHLL